MTASVQTLARDYVSALEAYLRRGDEAALVQAYEIGRRALVDGLGVIDAAELHRQALAQVVLVAPAADRPRFAAAAGDLFRELLSPFEMTLRGYRAANDELSRVNETLVQQRDSLEMVNRELESFSYSVSHDLRAPLRSIDGFSQALLEDCGDRLDAEGAEYLRFIRESTQHMGRLIDALLALARVTRSELRCADADVSALARRIAETIRARAPERKVRFEIQEGIHAQADEALLAVVLENLLGNAWKFTSRRDEAVIEVGTGERDGETYYFVRDNGAGFDMKLASKLFGAFQRLHSASEFEGTGIGLATVQRVIHRHHGQVWAEGRPGQGATFFFTLGAGGRQP